MLGDEFEVDDADVFVVHFFEGELVVHHFVEFDFQRLFHGFWVGELYGDYFFPDVFVFVEVFFVFFGDYFDCFISIFDYSVDSAFLMFSLKQINNFFGFFDNRHNLPLTSDFFIRLMERTDSLLL